VQVQAMAARTLAAQPSPDEDEASQALARLDNRTAAHPDDSPALWLSIRARLLARLERNDEALALHGQAITAATEAHPWARARAHYLHALTLHKLGQPDAACDALWQAAAIMPTSPVTALAQRQQTLWLAPADSADTGLESLHTDIARLRSKHHDSLPTGTYGLLPQGLDAIRLAGLRPTEVRLEAYGLQDWLPANAHALDATANQGLLLLGLADQLAKGTGLDERAFNQALFTAVAKYLDIRHVELLEQSFASFPHKQRFDLILACGLHSSQELTAAEIGQKCYQLTRPGGLVLLESRGTGSSEQIEAGFTSKVDDIAARGFDTVHSGYLCDDKRNRRMFVLLRRQ